MIPDKDEMLRNAVGRDIGMLRLSLLEAQVEIDWMRLTAANAAADADAVAQPQPVAPAPTDPAPAEPQLAEPAPA